MAAVIQMSDRELTRLRVMTDLADDRLTVDAAATLIGLGRRQIYRPPLGRFRSMASLRLGTSVIKNGDTWRLIFESDDVKTKRRIVYDVPIGLSGAMERYITVEREELLAGKTNDWFWVNQYGRPLTVCYIKTMIRTRSRKAFGTAFGPHRFRHAMGTTAPITDPAHPGVAAAILGISERMVEAALQPRQTGGRREQIPCKSSEEPRCHAIHRSARIRQGRRQLPGSRVTFASIRFWCSCEQNLGGASPRHGENQLRSAEGTDETEQQRAGQAAGAL